VQKNLEVIILNLHASQYPIKFKGGTYRRDHTQYEVTINLISHKMKTEVNR